MVSIAAAMLVLSWLGAHAPVLAAVVSVLLLAVLLWSVVRALRGPARLERLAVLGGFVALGLVVSSLVAIVTERDSSALASDLRGTGAVESLALGHDDGRTSVRLRLAAPPTRGDAFWLVFASAPADAVIVERAGAGWRASVPRRAAFGPHELAMATDGREITISFPAASARRALAVVTSRGDRVPDVGYAVVTDGRTDVEGGDPTRLARRVAEAQGLLPLLSPQQRELASTILGRYVVDGTYVYDLEIPSVDQPLTALVAVRHPELVVHVYADAPPQPRLLLSTHVLEDGEHVCRRDGDALRCTEQATPTDIQLLDVEGIAAAPDAVRVDVAPSREVDRQVATCLRIVESVELGPALGETCATADHVPAYTFVERTGQRLTLRERTTIVDPTLLEPPRNG